MKNNRRHRKQERLRKKGQAVQPVAQKPTPAPCAFSQASWLPDGVWLEMELDALNEIHDIIMRETKRRDDRFQKSFAALQAQGADHEWLDTVIDDGYANCKVERWSTLLQAIAVYHQIEDQLKFIFLSIFSGCDREARDTKLRDVSTWKSVRKMLNESCAVELTKISRYNDVNELRLICNAVKHTGGQVTRELSEFTKSTLNLKRGDDIKSKDVDLKKYGSSASEFVVDFRNQAEAGLTKKFGKPH
ncbi:hypothetical protein WME88_34360 [Sorangium sp. So ce216]